VFCASAPGNSQLVGSFAVVVVLLLLLLLLLLLPHEATIRLSAASTPTTVTRQTFARFISLPPNLKNP